MADIEARAVRLSSRIIGTPLTNAVIFFSIVVVGCLYIMTAKLRGLSAGWVTFGPVAVMIAYALLIGLARPLRLRDDQSGDNLYYMGFLFTLTSLGVSLYQFNTFGAAELIVQNFGVAIASTITGIALRIFFNQMRRDPIEVEAMTRTELADAARRVRRELDHTVLEFNHFRRTAQQMIVDGFAETKLKVDEVGDRLLSGLEDVTKRSAEPLEAASKHSGMTLDELTKTIVYSLETAAQHLAGETERLSTSTSSVAGVLEGISSKLAAMSTPDRVIEIKLDPTIEGLSQAVTTFGKNADIQTVAMNQAVEIARTAAENSASLINALQKELAARDTTMQQAIEAAQAAAIAAKEMVSEAAAIVKSDKAQNDEAVQDTTANQDHSTPLFKGPWERSDENDRTREQTP